MYATQGDDILVNLYIQSSADIQTANNKVRIGQKTEYPWDGTVIFTVTPDSAADFALRLRIPGWAENSPVPTDLYSFTDKAERPYVIKVNGREVKAMSGSGYATLKRVWQPGDEVELSLPMDVRRVRANENVTDDLGKLAIERGPVVYCLEGKDQADSTVFNKYIPDGAVFTAAFEPELLNGVVTLSASARQVASDGTETDVTVKAIPYSDCSYNRFRCENVLGADRNCIRCSGCDIQSPVGMGI